MNQMMLDLLAAAGQIESAALALKHAQKQFERESNEERFLLSWRLECKGIAESIRKFAEKGEI